MLLCATLEKTAFLISLNPDAEILAAPSTGAETQELSLE
jgi:hypothetical protein